MNKKSLCSIIVLCSIINSIFAVSPKREWRSTWLATVSNIDWPSKRGITPEIIATQKQEMTDYLDGLAMMNMNAMCFQVRSMCDAMYQSSYEPWSSYLTGKRGTDPGWDPLAFVVEECHKRGIDCYAWVNPYRWTNNEKGWNTAYDNSLKERNLLLSSGKYTYLNPGLPQVREHIVKVCKEIITKYDIQGLIFDDYFYPSGIPKDNTAGDYQLWKNNDTDLSFGDWRRANVDLMIKNVYDMIQECRPDLRFGISPAGAAGRSAWKYNLPDAPFAKNDWQYERIYSDPLSWLNSGILDFISPQEYFHTDDSAKPFEHLTDWWDEMATHFGRHHYTSLSISCINSDNSQEHWDEHVNQTLIARRLARKGIFGLCYFSTKYLNGPAVTGSGAYFKEKLFPLKSLAPVVDWKKWINYNPVSNLKVENNSIKWDKEIHENAIIRYTVYAIPDSISFTDAITDDGLSNEYLLGISFSAEYSLPAEIEHNHWYAVCIYDGYGRESRPAIIGYNGDISETVSPIYPVNGEKVIWNCTFSWTATNATYNIEIAEDKDFKTIIYQQKWIKTPYITIDLGFADNNKEYYWRVHSMNEGKLETTSEVSQFISPTRTDAVKAELISPKEAENVGTDIVFEWKGDINADKFILQLSSTSDFVNEIYKIETTDSQVVLPSVFVNIGTFYWRIISEGKHVNSSVSDYRSLVVTEIGIGDYEEGYEIKNDTYNYTDKDGVSVKNLWMRSVKDDFANITFKENGKLNRSFIAKDGYVYLAGREENSSSSPLYLRKYNGYTGEHIEDKYIYNSSSIGPYPCNTIAKDSKGNVCIANMSTRIDTVPIIVNYVDLNTCWAKELCRLTCSEGGRVDHVAVYGDVTTQKFCVFAAIKETNKIVRWTVTGDSYIAEVCLLKNFYPTKVTALGSAPVVVPITENDIFVDGSTIPLARYDFTTGMLTESFAESKSLAPQKTSSNGAKIFTLGEQWYIAHAYNTHNSTNNKSNIQLVSVNDLLDFGSMKGLWTLPYEGLGEVSSGTLQVVADYETLNVNSGIIYVYAPGNGLSAYEITDNTYSSAIVNLNHDEKSVEYYNFQGVKVQNPTSGIYVKRIGSTYEKVIIRNL